MSAALQFDRLAGRYNELWSGSVIGPLRRGAPAKAFRRLRAGGTLADGLRVPYPSGRALRRYPRALESACCQIFLFERR